MQTFDEDWRCRKPTRVGKTDKRLHNELFQTQNKLVKC